MVRCAAVVAGFDRGFRTLSRHMVFGVTDTTSSGFFLLTLLGAITDTMTSLITQIADNFGLLSSHLFLAASVGLVTDFATVTADVHSAFEWDTGIGKTRKVVLGILGPFGEESWTLSLVGGEVTDGVLLADFAL
jgi:hypothetical protein